MATNATNQKKNNKKLMTALLVLALAVVALLLVYRQFGPQTSAGNKSLTISVESADGATTDYAVLTDAEYLRQAMDEADGLTYEMTDGMVITINGERADWNEDSAYWAFYVNGEYCQYGVDEQPVADGDEFDIVYTPAQ
ncbi:MAG: DUF4430 domain-containing protein [Eubacteriales bacterium]|nr:DUF4430 domain-containing protein [Eubacteriales bacterium]